MRTHQTKAALSTNFSSTAVAVVLFFALIAEIGPIRSTLVTCFNPAVALLLGGTVLGEPLTVGTVLGLALFLAGSFLTTHAPRAAGSRKDVEAEDREAPPDQAFIGSPPEVRARSGGP
jgi:drug/metabolite transporter (DMT)-like permease